MSKGGTQMIPTQGYWFSNSLGDTALPIMDIDIGTDTKIDKNKDIIEPLTALNTELLIQMTGTKTMNVMNQPAPKGNGKYSVQNDFGDVFENRN